MSTMSRAAAQIGERAALQVGRLNFYWGDFKDLNGVNLHLAGHRVTAFIAPSGCRKSTLLRSFNRMYDPYPGQRAEGEILFNGQNLLDKKQDVKLVRAKIVMVVQKPTPFPMTIFENIAFMHLGELIESGPTDALFVEPKVKHTKDCIAGCLG